MLIKRTDKCKVIGQVDTFDPEDIVQFCTEKYGAKILAELLNKLSNSDPIDDDDFVGVRIGTVKGITRFKGTPGDLKEGLLIQMESGTTYVIPSLYNIED